ncbi:MAG: glycosyltransferase family 4 protein [Chloroflexi bacterium]|nr:glycosyltransferase family 4 protein [Chloroflexota bacterium]
MKILSVLTYYRPHTSGLTIYAERLAKAWVKRGHEVTILTSQYDPHLPTREVMDGVNVIRAPVLFRISKGVIMPTFGPLASRLALENDCIQLHLPQFDAAGIALRGRLLKKPTVVTYHCDLQMPKGLVSKTANVAVNVMNRLTSQFTHRFVTYTQDYADHSKMLKKYLDKVRIIPPPVELPAVAKEEIESFRAQYNPDEKKPVIGMASRFATEKGVEVLLAALPSIFGQYPQAKVWFAGEYKNIYGEEKYFERLNPQIQRYIDSGHWQFLGNLNPQQIACFYPNIDVLVIPSLNSTEAFGLVQIEAMINGVPSIASDLPGVRVPPVRHKMGKVIPIGDSAALADAVKEIVSRPDAYHQDAEEIAIQYRPDTVAAAYEDLFDEIAADISRNNQ